MTQYIDKSALVEEIEKRKLEWDYQSSVEALQKSEVYKEILSLIDTLEVKEMCLEKVLSYDDYIRLFEDKIPLI